MFKIIQKKVNEMESFLNMKDFGSFNTNYLIYDQANYLLNTVDNKIVRSMQLYFNYKT